MELEPIEFWQQKMLDFDLVWTVQEANYARAELLLNAGADANAVDAKGRRCLWHAIQLRDPQNDGTSQLGVAITQLLERYGASPESSVDLEPREESEKDYE